MGIAISSALYGVFTILPAGQDASQWKTTAAGILWFLLGPHLAFAGFDFWLLPNILIFSLLSYLVLFGSPPG